MQSEEINKLAEALAKAQAEIEDPHKNKTAKAGSYSYNYADIADVLKVARKALSKHHIAISQPTIFDGEILIVRTRLMHSSGQYIESDYPVCSASGDHQKMGAAMTYARRYALCSLVGVAADEDMDGQNAATAAPKSKPSKIVPSKMPRTDEVQHGQKIKTKRELHEEVEQELAQCDTLVRLEQIKKWYDTEWRERLRNGPDNFNTGIDELFGQKEEQLMANMEAIETEREMQA